MAQNDWGPAEGLRSMAERYVNIYNRLNQPMSRPSEADRQANEAYRREMVGRANASYRTPAKTRTEPSRRTTMTRTSSSRRGSRAR